MAALGQGRRCLLALELLGFGVGWCNQLFCFVFPAFEVCLQRFGKPRLALERLWF
jgi:hypothetical protein